MDICCIPEKIRHENLEMGRGAAMGDTKTFLRNEPRFLDTKNIHVRNPSFRLLAPRKGNTKILSMDF